MFYIKRTLDPIKMSNITNLIADSLFYHGLLMVLPKQNDLMRIASLIVGAEEEPNEDNKDLFHEILNIIKEVANEFIINIEKIKVGESKACDKSL